MQQPLSIRLESIKKLSLRTAEGGLQAPIYNTVAVIKILEVFFTCITLSCDEDGKLQARGLGHKSKVVSRSF